MSGRTDEQTSKPLHTIVHFLKITLTRFKSFYPRLLVCSSALLLPACVATPPAPRLEFDSAAYSELPGWPQDDLTEVSAALSNSCRVLKTNNTYLGNDIRFGRSADWQRICAALPSVPPPQLRAFITENFAPYRLSNNGMGAGLFTGYYQTELNGSLTPDARFTVPLYARPVDLVELEGKRVGKIVDGATVPYDTRAEVVANGLDGRAAVLAYVDDPVAAFFLAIQGSGIVKLPDGSLLPLGYAAQNGQPYLAIGRELIARGALTKENVSMQTIAAWLQAHPAEADAVMNTNPSYVFFKVMPTTDAVGAQGVPLVPLRSLAVDRKFIPYGALLWLTTDQPPLARLMVAQDTGGAIQGPVRGDVFWGLGPDAEAMAGAMKANGRYWALVPQAR